MPRLIVGVNDLQTKDATLSEEWHPVKNGDLLPQNVAHHSNKKFWWIGACGHEWDAVVSKRSSGQGCPYCKNIRVLSGFNDLLSQYPEIAKDWNYEKNAPLRPESISTRSNKKFWWIDSLGHEWEVSPDKRTSRNQGCPFCSGSQYLEDFNDLSVSHPHLAKEWSQNNLMSYNDKAVRNLSRILWLGECGHEWETTLDSRKSGSGCNICNKKVIKSHVNSFAFDHPKFLDEWDFSKNTAISPYEVSSGSSKKAWWIGSTCGHKWFASIVHRVSGKGCAVCVGKQVETGVNDLASVNPNLAKEFHPTKNSGLSTTTLLAGSRTKIWWLGLCGHEWKADPRHRMDGVGCPICAGKQILIGYNDLESIFPSIAQEWHPSKNGSLTPAHFTSKSGKKVWWQCKQNHEYESAVSARTSRGTGCEKCAQASTSKIQQAFHKELSKLIPDLQCDVRMPVRFRKRASMSADMVSEALKLVVEYDGYYYHSGGRSGQSMASHMTNDTEKTQALVDAGYRVVRIRENRLPHLSMKANGVFEIDYKYGDSMDDAIVMIKQWIESASY